jgi:glyoxylase-like metal-dependent hydrolase (beta-lactamase superfamily II)
MQVSQRVHLVGRGRWGGLDPLSKDGDCNVYLVDGGSELALVDVGIGPDFDDVWANIARDGLDTGKLATVLMTHAHCDHMGGLRGLRALARVTVHAGTFAKQAAGDLHPHLGAGRFVKELGVAKARRTFRIDTVVGEGDTVQVGDLTLDVVELPGHTPCGLGYVLTQGRSKFLFSGDTAIGDQGRVKGCIGWLDMHWGSDLAVYAETLLRLSRRRIDVLLPGHGLPIVGRDEVVSSLRHCRERLRNFRRFPDLGSMLPLRP